VSAAADVGDYLAAQPDEWRPTLERLRARCRRHLRGFTEEIAYKMPSYRRGERTEVAFAKQARYLSLYVMDQGVLDAHRAALAGLDLGKGCIRYRRPDQVDWRVVDALLRAVAAAPGDAC
jgi:uncharacterized protein YdhG (YjbR/CyaY superfamily)